MAMTLITTNTESGDANSSFTSGIDSTYKLYIFKFIDINPSGDAEYFYMNGSIDGGSNYNVSKTTTFWESRAAESGGTPATSYSTGADLANATGYQLLTSDIGSGADESAAGTLWLFNPSSTTYVKHFSAELNGYASGNSTYHTFIAGYFNTTDNIDAMDFKFGSGNFDGTIKMYGVG